MADRLYTKEHEWVEVEDGVATIGITDHAQEQLGDVVFVELPEVGRNVIQDEEAAVVESVKAASEVYAPVAGEIVEVNSGLADDPSPVNADAYGTGWFMRIKMADLGDLDGMMDEEAYGEFVAELE